MANQAVAPVEGEEEEENKKTQKAGLPLALYDIVESKAKDQDLSVRAYIRKIVAAEVGYEGPLVLTRAKADEDLSPEEKKNRRKQAGKARRDLFKMLYAQFQSHPELFGDIKAQLDEEDDEDEEDE